MAEVITALPATASPEELLEELDDELEEELEDELLEELDDELLDELDEDDELLGVPVDELLDDVVDDALELELLEELELLDELVDEFDDELLEDALGVAGGGFDLLSEHAANANTLIATIDQRQGLRNKEDSGEFMGTS